MNLEIRMQSRYIYIYIYVYYVVEVKLIIFLSHQFSIFLVKFIVRLTFSLNLIWEPNLVGLSNFIMWDPVNLIVKFSYH